jgi:hypothetical protein
MKILRSDSGGETSANERLKNVRNILLYFDIDKINLLHDHKGLLTVFWEKVPSDFEKEKVKDVWELFHEYEVEHKLITYTDL